MEKNGKPKISVIVPVYNTGDFLRECINSILSQTLKELELILVDDGSKDNSGVICDEYAQKDPRVKVLHKENAGVSAARNSGLEMVTGEFIGFIDSDDTIDPDMYETLYKRAEETSARIVMCDTVTVYGDNTTEPDTITQLPTDAIIKREEFSPKLLMEMAGSACRCIYKSELIKENSIVFPVGQKLSEDRVFNIYAFGFANKVCYIKKAFYNRLIWDGSAVNRFHADYFNAAKKAELNTTKALKEAWDDNIEFQNAYKLQFAFATLTAINNYFYKTSTLAFKEKFVAVKKLCNDRQLIEALEKCDSNDIRIKWLKNKNWFRLSISAILLNKKYGR